MSAVGLLLLLIAAVGSLTTRLPLFVVLLLTSTIGAGVVWLDAPAQASILLALPQRISSLLESDLLQAIPLFAFMGLLLDRVPVISMTFRAGRGLFRNARATGALAVPVSAMLAPMNGSVGASAVALSRSLEPELLGAQVPAAQAQALIAVGSVLGVALPPSLVLILLGDAMMSAHTTALRASGRADRVLNTQDIFHGALIPALAFIVLCAILAYWRARPKARAEAGASFSARQTVIALAPVGAIVLLLAGVAVGYFYAVEAAAIGAVGVFALGLATNAIRLRDVEEIVAEAFAVTGSLFAMLVAATTFTLVLRCLGTDALIHQLIAGAPSPLVTLIASLALVALSAFAFDAIEIIYVVIPLIGPSLLERAPDARWASVLIILVLQLSFLTPPLGLAMLFARARSRAQAPLRDFLAALLPYVCALGVVFGLTAAFPAMVHPERLLAGEQAVKGDQVDPEEALKGLKLPDVEAVAPKF